MRKPRDLDKYADKEGALGFLDEMRSKVESMPDEVLLKLSLDISWWLPVREEPGEEPQ